MSDIIRNIVARFKVDGVSQLGELKTTLDTVSKSTEDVASRMGTYRKAVATAAKELDVNTKISRRFVNTAMQAGFSATEQAKAMEKIKQVAQKTGKPVEIIEKAWEGLARTLQDADDATENLEDALRFQARAGIPEAEKAAAKYAQTIGGGTDALKSLTGVGKMYAAQLDEIRDADLKAKLTTELARKELNRKRESIERVKDSYLSMSLRMKAALGPSNLMAIKLMGRAVKALAVSVGVGLAGAFAIGLKSIKMFLDTEDTMKGKTDALKKAVLELQVAIGSALVGGIENGGDAVDQLTGKIRILIQAVNENREDIFRFAKGVVAALGIALRGVNVFVQGYRVFASFIGDAVELGVAIATESLMDLVIAAQTAQQKLIKTFEDLRDTLASLPGADKLPIVQALKKVDLSFLKRDLSEIKALRDAAAERRREGFIDTEDIILQVGALDSLIERLFSLQGMDKAFSTPEITDPAKDKGKGKAKKEKPGDAPAWVEENAAKLEERLAVIRLNHKIALEAQARRMAEAGPLAAFEDGKVDEQISRLNRLGVALGELTASMKETGKSALIDLGGNMATAFGAALESGESMQTALGAVFRDIVAQAASQFGKLFVLKGAALLLEAPPLGAAMIAAGLALQTFGGFVGAKGPGGGGAAASGGDTSAGAGAESSAFLPREQEREEPRETALVINIAGETVGPVIWSAMNEGLRLGQVSQTQGV